MPGSPSMRGSSEPAGQSTITWGSENNSALARSRSLRSAAISSREEVSSRVQRVRARTSMIAVTTANSTSPSTTTSTAISCRSMLSCALTTSSCSARAGFCSALAGNGKIAPTMAVKNPRRHGCAQLPLIRIVSGMPLRLCWLPPPPIASGSSRGKAPRIARLYSQAESRRKSPDRERECDGTWLKPARRQRGAMTCRAPRPRAPCLPD